VAIRYRKKRTAGGGMSRSPDAHRREVRRIDPKQAGRRDLRQLEFFDC
jgi:hypothetical protein